VSEWYIYRDDILLLLLLYMRIMDGLLLYVIGNSE
jgi:hypothetical protein